MNRFQRATLDRRQAYRWVEVDRRVAEDRRAAPAVAYVLNGLDVVGAEPRSDIPARVLVSLYEAANAIDGLAVTPGQLLNLAAAVGRARVYLPADHPDHV